MKINKKIIEELVSYLKEFNLSEIDYAEGTTKVKVSRSINSSVNFDRRLYRHDILASIIHAEMLMNSQIIGKESGNVGLLPIHVDFTFPN